MGFAFNGASSAAGVPLSRQIAGLDLSNDRTAGAMRSAIAGGVQTLTYDFTGATTDYTADPNWTPSGMTAQRTDGGPLSRGGARFMVRGTGRGTLQGVATGLRLQTTTVVEAGNGNQAYPLSDNGLSGFFELPLFDEIEVDLTYEFKLTQKATTGIVGARCGLMSFAAGSITAYHHHAITSFVSNNAGNPCADYGFGTSASGNAQLTTATSYVGALRFQRVGARNRIWRGPDINTLTKLYDTVTLNMASSRLTFTAGIANCDAAANAGSYFELRTLTVRSQCST